MPGGRTLSVRPPFQIDACSTEGVAGDYRRSREIEPDDPSAGGRRRKWEDGGGHSRSPPGGGQRGPGGACGARRDSGGAALRYAVPSPVLLRGGFRRRGVGGYLLR